MARSPTARLNDALAVVDPEVESQLLVADRRKQRRIVEYERSVVFDEGYAVAANRSCTCRNRETKKIIGGLTLLRHTFEWQEKKRHHTYN